MIVRIVDTYLTSRSVLWILGMIYHDWGCTGPGPRRFLWNINYSIVAAVLN